LAYGINIGFGMRYQSRFWYNHDICYRLKIIYIYGTWNSYTFFPNGNLMNMRKFYILNGILDRFLFCFYLSKKAKPILWQSKKNYYDICYRLKIIYIYGTWNSYKFFPNSDLMDMRKFYILNEILQPFLNSFFI
jgi:hypothetical protein